MEIMVVGRLLQLGQTTRQYNQCLSKKTNKILNQSARNTLERQRKRMFPLFLLIFFRTDTSSVKGETLMFSNLMFYVAFVILDVGGMT